MHRTEYSITFKGLTTYRIALREVRYKRILRDSVKKGVHPLVGLTVYPRAHSNALHAWHTKLYCIAL